MYSVDDDGTDHSLHVGSTEFPGPHSSPSVSLSAHRNDVAVPQSLSVTAGTLLELLTKAQKRVWYVLAVDHTLYWDSTLSVAALAAYLFHTQGRDCAWLQSLLAILNHHSSLRTYLLSVLTVTSVDDQ